MPKYESAIDRYRAGVADLLRTQIEAVSDSDRQLGIPVDVRETPARAVVEEDPMAPFRLTCALLLRKARLHMFAVRQANENDNLHSLTVQMRPILECVNQIVLIFHNLMIKPTHAESVIRDYINEDYYRTMICLTEGELSREHLLETISNASGMPIEKVTRKKRRRKARRVDPIDIIAGFEGSKNWCDYLSRHFRHNGPDWTGDPWRGSVNSTNTEHDRFTFAVFMDYLVNRVAVMNAYAALCPVAMAALDNQITATLAQLGEVRATTKALRESAESAITKPHEQGTN